PPTRHQAPLRYVAMLASVLLLLLTGVVLVLSASTVAGINDAGESFFYFNRHLLYVGLAIIIVLVTVRIDYRHMRKLAVPLAVTSIAGLVTVLMQGRVINGSRRWIDAGPFTIQPSEIAKFALVIGLAVFLDQRSNQLTKSHRILRPTVLALGSVCVLVIMQPDLGTSLILFAIAVGMLFAAGVPKRDVAKVVGGVAVIGGALGWAATYRRERITGFMNPIEERLDTGYQTFQSLVGLANGGVGGVGLGQGQAKWGWLPNAHTDFIFAIVGEELGLIGALVVLGLLAGIGLLGFRTSQMAPDMFGSLVAAGLSVWLMVQVFVNIGGVVGLLPITGVTLPFLSFGGSSLLMNAAAAGVLLNIARQSR
ncbi:MAG: putative lipid II flippase FtsW, partial [Actinomycetota bacterium]|nr:putative lipid II flippase FtsW [Actinomycetota bacterium]